MKKQYPKNPLTAGFWDLPPLLRRWNSSRFQDAETIEDESGCPCHQKREVVLFFVVPRMEGLC